MVLSIGTKLGPYTIVSPLGSGGMGEVYRGHDTRLDRDVAIKILPREFSSDPDRLRRFEQEARSASALNHPNIITIYDIGTLDGGSYIAMEYIDGQTIRELLSSGPLSVRKAINIASQLTEGLAKAHEAGIIHRDLKPENIMVTKDGYVKILDFGLAKLLSSSEKEGLSSLPTTGRTETGMILGTVGYMSPEQASGTHVDFRSDQFSAGSILYEMVTGKRAFQKKTNVETLAGIINDSPELLSATSNVPAPLRWTIERCLEKDPADRYTSTRDLYRDLQTIRDHFSEIAKPDSPPMRIIDKRESSARKIFKVSAVILALILGVSLFYLYRMTPTESGIPSYRRLTYRRGPIRSARFTPDGQIVYSATFEQQPEDLYLTRTQGVESRPLGIRNAEVLAVSSTGEMLLLIRGEKSVLAQMSVTGGSPREIDDNITSADWAPDGKTIAVGRRKSGRGYLEFPAGKVLHQGKSIELIRHSPTGDHIAFVDRTIVGAANGRIVIVDSSGQQVAAVDRIEALYPDGIAWTPDGKAVLFTTWGAGIGGGSEMHALSVSGKQRLIARFPATTALCDISQDGTFLVNQISERVTLMVGLPEERSEQDLSWLDYSYIRDISKDGKKLLIHEAGEGGDHPSGSAYVRNTDSSPAVRVAGSAPAEFSGDGKSILTYGKGRNEIMMIPIGAGEGRSFVYPQFEEVTITGMLPDDQAFMFSALEKNGQQKLHIQKVNGGTPQFVAVEIAFRSRTKRLSPDGRFVLLRKPDDNIYVMPIAGGQASPLSGVQPLEIVDQWSRDGSSVLVHNPAELPIKIYKVDILTGRREFFKEISPPDPVGITGIFHLRFSLDERTYAYSYNRDLATLYLLERFKID